MRTVLALVPVGSCGAASAQTAAPPRDDDTRGGEPQLAPKGGQARSYEIITSDGSRETSDNVSGTRGATGKPVWNVLSF